MSGFIEFMAPRFVGERFQGHTIPLEVLRDLAVLEEMVGEVAKWKYLEEHQDRKRVPKGFTEGISLRMVDIGDGSAIPKLVLVAATTGALTFLPPDNQPYFEKARDAIINCIDAAERSQDSVTRILPSSYLAYFDRLGRSLRDDETIEFNPENREHPARLNRITRHRLLQFSLVNEWTEELSERGTVPEIDQDKKRFTLQLLSGAKVQMPLEPQHKKTILDAFIGFDQNLKILVQGIGRFNKLHKLESFDSIEHVILLDPLDVPTRLIELSQLKDGWLEGKGKAPAKSSSEWLGKAFDINYDPDLPLPYIYPTPEGGIQAEWELGTWEITLEVDLIHHTAQFQAMSISTGKTVEKDYNLAIAQAWHDLNSQLATLQEEHS